jgi:hypothetical protein
MPTKKDGLAAVVAIAAIAIIETAALLTHTDGRYLGLAIAAIAGLGGFFLARATKT